MNSFETTTVEFFDSQLQVLGQGGVSPAAGDKKVKAIRDAPWPRPADRCAVNSALFG